MTPPPASSSLDSAVTEGEFGLQPNGEFNRKKVEAIQKSLLAFAREEFGETANLAPGSPKRQLIDVATIELTDLWEALEGTYYATYFEDAWGEALDRVLAIAGVGRMERRGATGEVTFSIPAARSVETPIRKSIRVSTPPGDGQPAIPFRTTAPAVIPAGETSVSGVPVRALEPFEPGAPDEEYLGAATNVDSGAITQFIDRVQYVSDVINPLPTGDSGTHNGEPYNFIAGRDRETDSELKARYEESLGSTGSATLDAIRARVYTIEGVANATIEENYTTQDNTASGGLPPKSFRVTALADSGLNDAITQAILKSKPIGIEPYGDTQGSAIDGGGVERTYAHDLAGDVTIYVDVNATVEDTFPTDGADRIIDNIVQYIGGTDTTDTKRRGTDIGEDVIYDRVDNASVPDDLFDHVIRTTVNIGTTTTPTGTSDIQIDDRQQVATTVPSAITVDTSTGQVP